MPKYVYFTVSVDTEDHETALKLRDEIERLVVHWKMPASVSIQSFGSAPPGVRKVVARSNPPIDA